MSEIRRVTIGIQARSTSHRLPGKVHEMIGGKTMLEHLIDSCNESQKYLNRYADKNKYFVSTALCIPTGDRIKEEYGKRISIIEGPEHDVLSRYMNLASQCKTDYLVRVTADCPLLPAFVISKHITTALMNEYDYISNVDELCRTAADGMDCEVISRKYLEYANANAKEAKDREHVTTYLRSNPPDWVKRGVIINFLDLSQLKLSVDTLEDLERVKLEYNRIEGALKAGAWAYGRQNVHRL